MLLLEKNFKKKVIVTLKSIAEKAKKHFSGIGLLVYEADNFSKLHYSNLRPSYLCPKGYFLDDIKTIEYLSEISDKTHPLHDGFIFFNDNCELTHISQYFAPLPIKKITPNENYGTRYRTAQYGSLLKGVILSGVISHDRNYFIFYKGSNIISNKELVYIKTELGIKV